MKFLGMGSEHSGSSTMGKWLDRFRGHGITTSHVKAGADGLRLYGESAVVGAGLGAIATRATEQQNDMVQGGLAIAGAAVAAIGGAAGESYATDARNAGATALGILAYRKTQKMVATKMGGTAHGESDMGEDPILTEAARHL